NSDPKTESPAVRDDLEGEKNDKVPELPLHLEHSPNPSDESRRDSSHSKSGSFQDLDPIIGSPPGVETENFLSLRPQSPTATNLGQTTQKKFWPSSKKPTDRPSM
ncbi:MAG: hypothetical protein V4487_08975, partial [Chlamydiota bacterium]